MTRFVSRFAVAVCTVAASVAASAQFNFEADFSITNGNPNGVWSYGYTTSLAGTFNAHTAVLTNSQVDSWYTPGLSGDFTPSVYKNTSSGSFNGLGPGMVALHSGPSGEFGVARFTSPQAGEISVVGLFRAGDSGDVDLFVLRNGSTEFSSFDATSDTAFSETFVVNTGDTIDFVVGYSGAYQFDTTPLTAQLNFTPVPEPATMAALGLGAIALLRRRRASK